MALEAADRIILEQGYGGLTGRKVASEIGYTVGTQYLVFEKLNDLITHINALQWIGSTRSCPRVNRRIWHQKIV